VEDQLSNNFKKNVYLKPDEYLNGWAKKCGWKASLVYDSLWRHADENHKCFPSIELMAEENGVSRDTIMRGLKTLIEHCLVDKEEKRSSAGKFLFNSYTLLDKTKWKEPTKSLTATRSTKSLTASNQVAHSDYKDTHKKDTHKLVTKVTNTAKPNNVDNLKRTNNLSVSRSQMIAVLKEFPGLSTSEVREQIGKCNNYMAMSSCEYQNPGLFFRGWLKRYADEKRKAEAVEKKRRAADESLPKLSEDQVVSNWKRLAELKNKFQVKSL